jgi:hypothetical protein
MTETFLCCDDCRCDDCPCDDFFEDFALFFEPDAFVAFFALFLVAM